MAIPKPTSRPGSSADPMPSTSDEPASAGGGISHLRAGPPRVPRVPEDLAIQRQPGETDEEFKYRVTQLRYSSVTGTTELEEEMVDFYKQALSAQSRGVLDTFTYHVLASRHWGKYHKEK